MHVLIVNFQAIGFPGEAMSLLAEQVAPAFAAIPGLVSKTWLARPATDTYGGVYTFESREAADAYKQSELFAEMGKNPYFSDITISEFGVMTVPSEITSGLASPFAKAA